MNGNAFLTANFYVYPKKLFCTQLASIKLNLRIEFAPRNVTIYDRLIVHNPLPPSNIYLDHLLNSLRNNLLRSELQQLTRLHARLHSLCAANFFPGIVGLKYCRYLLKYCFMGNAQVDLDHSWIGDSEQSQVDPCLEPISVLLYQYFWQNETRILLLQFNDHT